VGADSDAILHEVLGFDAERIQALRDAGAFGAVAPTTA